MLSKEEALDANLQVILQQLQGEKGIERETLLEAIRSALESAARKSFSHAANVTVEVDPDSLAFKVFEIRTVVEDVEDPTREMGLEEAQALNPEVGVGERLKVQTEPKDFGRIAAQTAKQVIIQKIKDAERENVYEEFKQREGELITGIVKRLSHGNIIVSVGRGEAILPQREQSPRENFKQGDRIRAQLITVERSPRGPQIILSRATPDLVRALFDLEVPEIYDGTVQIRGIAREPGSRTKIAVASTDSNVDPVGACVGMKGSRVRAVVEELCGEKIDIGRWSEDPIEMCGNALNPADILDMTIDEDSNVILVVVPHDQLSLAIGKRGQNARLASRLIGWNIDINSDVEIAGGGEDSAAAESNDEAASAESDDEAASAESNDEAAPVESNDEAAPVESNDEIRPSEPESEGPTTSDDDNGTE